MTGAKLMAYLMRHVLYVKSAAGRMRTSAQPLSFIKRRARARFCCDASARNEEQMPHIVIFRVNNVIQLTLVQPQQRFVISKVVVRIGRRIRVDNSIFIIDECQVYPDVPLKNYIDAIDRARDGRHSLFKWTN